MVASQSLHFHSRLQSLWKRFVIDSEQATSQVLRTAYRSDSVLCHHSKTLWALFGKVWSLCLWLSNYLSVSQFQGLLHQAFLVRLVAWLTWCYEGSYYFFPRWELVSVSGLHQQVLWQLDLVSLGRWKLSWWHFYFDLVTSLFLESTLWALCLFHANSTGLLLLYCSLMLFCFCLSLSCYFLFPDDLCKVDYPFPSFQ